MTESRPSGAPTDDEEHLERLRRELARGERSAERASAPPHDARFDAPGEGKGRRRAGLAGLGALLAAALAKLKVILPALKVLKLGKLVMTAGTMAISIWAYALAFGYPFAIGFVLLIFVHEMGHAAMIRARGMRASAPIFIPFFGALIALKDQPRDAKTEAEIAIAGPIAGGAAAAACWGVGLLTGRPIFLALAYSGFFLNLFNLLPISPLDGGRIVGAVSRWLWIAGLAIALPLALSWHQPVLLIFVVLGAFRAIGTWRAPERSAAYFAMPTAVRRTIAVSYFGLAAILALSAVALHAGSPATGR